MARSPFTLAAAVTAALPGAEVTGARALTSDGDGRFDSAIATLADGREVVIRAAVDDAGSRELSEESLALRALTAGAREMLPFRAPAHLGETTLGIDRALVTDLMPGFQIDAGDIPAGRGAAVSVGAAIAAVHALPTSVVRAAGLSVRDAAAVRDEIQQLIDRAADTGRVPARLTSRWRSAAADDELWRFETAVTLAGVQAQSFLFEDDPDDGPQVTGMIGWRGLTVGDPAEDLGWLSGAREAADDVFSSYAAASSRASDEALRVRARLHAELEFVRWLVHGDELRRPDIVDDAAGLLQSLADGLRSDDLRVVAAYTGGVDSALDVLDRTPDTPGGGVDTSMQTDAYRAEELWQDETDGDQDDAPDRAEAPEQAGVAGQTDVSGAAEHGNRSDAATAEAGTEAHPSWDEPTQDLSEVSTVRGGAGRERSGVEHPAGERPDAQSQSAPPSDIDSAEEAQRAARAALQRWTNSASE
ncbi:phosphotransferase [Microbacterium sp. ARD32]|uniref:phosphotransferase n=1 Tax=Microbacterium sp. ARD32 TaxID=2962577 RepID=UPI0028812EDB|nr:phosphotransferase [Microbacterium sp. ARD32]MDT0156720.1 phosphotransferase [Microbacterium sp. ARD32]